VTGEALTDPQRHDRPPCPRLRSPAWQRTAHGPCPAACAGRWSRGGL